MREVVADLLWIGNALDARDLKGVLAQRIEAVIDFWKDLTETLKNIGSWPNESTKTQT